MRKIISALLMTIVAMTLVFSTCKVDDNKSSTTKKVVVFKEPYISKQPESISFKPNQYLTASHTLKIEIDAWDDEDGVLSYQWYSFDDAAEYLANNEQGDIISGANELEYTLPNNLDTTEGNRYYYYVEVTNTNSKATSGKTTGKIRSTIVTVAFTRPGESDIPRIVVPPTDAEYAYGDAMEPLTVIAQVDSGILSYQWYTGDIKNGTKIDEAIFATHELDLDKMQRGDNYYWVVVTNTEPGSYPSTTTSFPAIITLNKSMYAMVPVITQQPNDLFYLVGESSSGGITVGAESPDSGELSYQWYSNNTASNAGGTLIANATNVTYAPTVNTASTGTFYYYVIVTNTSEYANNPATTTSKVATVQVHNPATIMSNATVTILNPTVADNRYQYIRGYGTTYVVDVLWADYPETPPETTKEDTELMYSPDGLGYNILRIMIMSPGDDEGDYNGHGEIVQKLLDTDRPNYLNNVKVVNKHGGYVLATPWTPPKEWKTNGSINANNSGYDDDGNLKWDDDKIGEIKPEHYSDYANYLKDFARYMHDQGAPIYALSIQNEPNYASPYDGCLWSDGQMRDFWKQVGHFTDGVPGYGGGKSTPVVLTMNGESANHPGINFATLDDPVSRAVVDLYGRQVYGSQSSTLWGHQYADYKEGSQYQTECWMTQHNINSAAPAAFPHDSTWNYVWRFMNDIDLVIRLNNENAFIWWAGKQFYSMIGDGQYGTQEGIALPRGYGLSHYAKYTIDKTRLGVSVSGTTQNGTTITQTAVDSIVNNSNFGLDSTSAKITAYVSQDGNEIAMVMWTPTDTNGLDGHDMGTIKVDMPAGFTIGNVSAQKSSSGHYMVTEEVGISANRQSAFVTLPAGTILSVRFTKKQ